MKASPPKIPGVPSHTLLAAIVDSSDDAIISKDLDGMIMSWNIGAQRIFGYTADEAIGQSITIIIPPEQLEEERKIIERLRRGERIDHFETVRQAKDGTRLDISLTVSPVKDASGKIIGASKIARDITERRRAREQLQRSEERFRVTLTSIGDAVIATNANGRITFMNAVAEQLTGWSCAEAQGQPLEAVFKIVNEHTRAAVENPATKILKSGLIVGLANHTLLIAKDGVERPIDDSGAPIRDPGGELFGVVLVFRDVTERRRTEKVLNEAQKQLALRALDLEAKVRERTAKLQETVSELEAFSYSLSHDMRAPLRAIQSFTEIVTADHGEKIGVAGTNHLKRVTSAAQRMERLIQDVLAYSQVSRRVITFEPIDVARLIEDIIKERPEFQPPQAEIVIERPLLPLVAHVMSLTQCLTNLLDNAVKFVARGVKPQVRISTELIGREVRLWIKDNGIGIEREAQKRLFVMFQRLNAEREYPGTGIGLVIVRKAAERMGGQVGMESEPGKGSRFWLQLPRARS